jgi:hypothetical protein
MGISTFKKSKEFGPFFAGYLAGNVKMAIGRGYHPSAAPRLYSCLYWALGSFQPQVLKLSSPCLKI